MTSEPEHRSWDERGGALNKITKHGMAKEMAQRDVALPHAVGAAA